MSACTETLNKATLLTIPAELRNQIYLLIFNSDHSPIPGGAIDVPNPLAVSLKLKSQITYAETNQDRVRNELRVLSTCKQIYSEAQLLALSMTTFDLRGDTSYPDLFDIRSRALSATKLHALRHITLTARISHLRALNEAWSGIPFGHPSLDLDTLTIVPKRPEVCNSAYAELADLSQSHTLAYIFSESLKGLRNVKCVELRNQSCFNEVVWRLFYRSLIYRMWRWGGGRCGLKFQCSEEGVANEKDNQWFRVYLQGGDDRAEVGQEVMRLAGLAGELPDPDLAGVLP